MYISTVVKLYINKDYFDDMYVLTTHAYFRCVLHNVHNTRVHHFFFCLIFDDNKDKLMLANVK